MKQAASGIPLARATSPKDDKKVVITVFCVVVIVVIVVGSTLQVMDNVVGVIH